MIASNFAYFCYLTTIAVASNVYNDSIVYTIDWNLQKSSHDSEVSADDGHRRLEMITKNKEKYVCTMPNVDADDGNRIEEYTGPNPYELLKPLYDQKIAKCTYRLEPYWTYELCHGKFLRQYHEEKNSMRKSQIQEYYLGSYVESIVKDMSDKFDVKKIQSRRIDEKLTPYLPVRLVQGTQCDITGEARETTLHYICDPDGKSHMDEITETESCKYEVVVPTAELCEHPAFARADQKTHSINCQPIGDAPLKPSLLAVIERETELDEIHKYGTYNEIIKPGDEPILRQQPNSKPTHPQVDNPNKDPQRSSFDSPESMLNSILNSDLCLYGGQGWWRHEFCHKLMVTQYHEYNDGVTPKDVIKLGKWDEQKHKSWMKTHPHKSPVKASKRDPNRITQVSHYYSDGDYCEEASKPRECEVRLRCNENLNASPQSVTIFLMEPERCQYVMGVESPMFCDPMQIADEFGLF